MDAAMELAKAVQQIMTSRDTVLRQAIGRSPVYRAGRYAGPEGNIGVLVVTTREVAEAFGSGLGADVGLELVCRGTADGIREGHDAGAWAYSLIQSFADLIGTHVLAESHIIRGAAEQWYVVLAGDVRDGGKTRTIPVGRIAGEIRRSMNRPA